MRVPKWRLSLIVLLMLASCGRKDPLVGKWQEVDGNEWAEYFSEGTVIFNDGSMSISGAWKRLEDGRLKIDATVLGTNSTLVYEVSIEGDTADFISSEGEVERYRRVSTTTRAAETKEVPSAAGVRSDSAGHPSGDREAQEPLAGTNQTGSSTAMTTAEAIVKANPDLDLVGSDAEAGTLTVLNRQTGEEVTLRAADLEEGRIVFDTQSVTNQLITKIRWDQSRLG